ncbi:hypothetical protein ILUMI_09696 [Ignelater luminosus]|uniref:Uncharacterized protein n=1 Tax=Ignelater luminosus TaxID=2038154 RepID=A0A8K0CZA1_IGNLU|nr:hypothetical protein ILUMI_09696 [Ignelater luminosus]
MNVITSTEYMPPEVRNMNGYYNHNLSHQKQGCGRAHDREWESAVNGRAKPRVVAVPTLTQSAEDAKRDKTDRKNSRSVDAHNIRNINTEPKPKSAHIRSHMESSSERVYYSHNRSCVSSSKSSASQSKNKQAHASHQSHSRSNAQRALPVPVGVQKVKGVVGYQSRVDYVGGGFVGHDSGVFGMYSETRYAFAVDGLPGNPAQASAAAAFFAR